MYGSVRGVPGNRHSYRDKVEPRQLRHELINKVVFRSYGTHFSVEKLHLSQKAV